MNMTDQVMDKIIVASLCLLSSNSVFANLDCASSLEPVFPNNQNVLDSDFKTAILNQDTEKVRELLLQGVNPNNISEGGINPLFHTVWNKNVPLVKVLLQSDIIDVNATTNWLFAGNTTPLMLASEKELTEIARLLVKHIDIKINLQNSLGDTALMLAIIKQHVSIVDILINADKIDLLRENIQHKNTLQVANNQKNNQAKLNILNIIKDSKAYKSLNKEQQILTNHNYIITSTFSHK